MAADQQRRRDEALQASTDQADCAPFIAFMPRMLMEALAAVGPQVAPQVSPQVGALLRVLRGDMTRETLQAALGLRDRKSFRARYLQPALAAGLIEMTIPDRPNSRLQRYRLTERGRQWRAGG